MLCTPRPASRPQSPAALRARSMCQQRPEHDVVRRLQAGVRPSHSEAQHLRCKAVQSFQVCNGTSSHPARAPRPIRPGRMTLAAAAGMQQPTRVRWGPQQAEHAQMHAFGQACNATGKGIGLPIPVRHQRSAGGHARLKECLQARFQLPLEESRLPQGVNAARAGPQLPSWLQRIGEVGHHLHQGLQLRCQRGHAPQVDVPAGQAGTWSSQTTGLMMVCMVHVWL